MKKIRTDGGIGTYEQKDAQHTDNSVYEAKVEIDNATIKRIADRLCSELQDDGILINWTGGMMLSQISLSTMGI